MTLLAYSHTLVPGTPEDINDVQEMFDDVRTLVNGNLDDDNVSTLSADSLTSTVNQAVGLSSTGVVRRGKSIIATEQARTNTAYGLLTTPDQVSSVVLPTDGLISIMYHATWKESVLDAARVAIFIGSNQLKVTGNSGTTPVVTEAAHNGNAGDIYRPIGTCSTGIFSLGTASANYTGDVTTGQVVGVESGGAQNSSGPCYIFAAAGTYDISIQYKSTSGSVTVKDRKLWVWTMGF